MTPVASWRYDYNNVRPHSSLENQTPAEARRTLEQFEASTLDALAQNENTDFKIQNPQTLVMKEGARKLVTKKKIIVDFRMTLRHVPNQRNHIATGNLISAQRSLH